MPLRCHPHRPRLTLGATPFHVEVPKDLVLASLPSSVYTPCWGELLGHQLMLTSPKVPRPALSSDVGYGSLSPAEAKSPLRQNPQAYKKLALIFHIYLPDKAFTSSPCPSAKFRSGPHHFLVM